MAANKSTTNLRVKAIYTYPIKSIRGCTPKSLKATAVGFAYDRRFMLIRDSDSTNMHVSHFPEMCLFTTELSSSTADPHQPDNIIVCYGKDHVFNQPDTKLADRGPLIVPAVPDVHGQLHLDQVEVNMHGSPTQGWDMGSKYNDWFSARLGYKVRLLYIADNRRKVLGNVTPLHPMHGSNHQPSSSSTGGSWLGSIQAVTNGFMSGVARSIGSSGGADDATFKGVDKGIGFADCAPFLVVSATSLENVSGRLPDGEDMDITKFRPNIVVEGADYDFEEDYWAELQIGAGGFESESESESESKACIRLLLTANCARCNSLNVDYTTGKVGVGESGKVLKKLQKDRRVDPGMKYSPVFGRYGFLAHRSGANGDDALDEVEIKVGDSVQVVKRNDARTRFQWPALSTDK